MLERLVLFPIGYSEVSFQNKKYSVTKKEFNMGKSLKVFAQELSGKDFISFNLYLLEKGIQLKPCEMPKEKVLEFINGFQLLQDEK
ncbi:peptide-methionine (S)-S-oxide reductase [Flavobacteriaceae bacterium MAR_2010_188]|nr:peptide-methionine (S)-S-oxide reductase [Flavobacteriaceae bacterium MAR_2010_188]